MRPTLIISLIVLILTGCASDPLMSGKPQDWVGHQATELRGAMGEPARIIPSANGAEIWEFVKDKDYVVPKGENMSFGFGGLGGPHGGAGAFSMEKRPDDQAAHETKLFRFKIKNGVVSEWYANRVVNGRMVWEDH